MGSRVRAECPRLGQHLWPDPPSVVWAEGKEVGVKGLNIDALGTH